MENAPSVHVNKLYPPPNARGKIKALADIVIAGKYVAKGIKVVEGPNGLFVAMPSMKENGAYQDKFHPITKEGREELSALVLEAFQKKQQA